MQLSRLSHELDLGWSVESFPILTGKQNLIFVFGAPAYRDKFEVFQDLASRYPDAMIVGCSTAGEIHGSSIKDNSLAVAVLSFESTQSKVASLPITTPSDSRVVGVKLGESLKGENLKGVLVFSDGLTVNGSELVRGLNSALPKNVVVTGGLAGDGQHFKETWVLVDGQPRTGFVTVVGLYGDKIQIGHGSKGGWDIFGPERIITKSKDNVLYELDHTPALDLYKRYLGELAKGLPATALLFPLAIRVSDSDVKSLVRTVLGVDEATKSMTFAGDIPEGHRARLMRASFDRLVEGAIDAAQAMDLAKDDTRPTFSIAISCVGRRLVLGTHSEEETEAIIEVLPKGTVQIGFYSYGEISPFVSGEPCDLHNQTMTLTTLQEAD